MEPVALPAAATWRGALSPIGWPLQGLRPGALGRCLEIPPEPYRGSSNARSLLAGSQRAFGLLCLWHLFWQRQGSPVLCRGKKPSSRHKVQKKKVPHGKKKEAQFASVPAHDSADVFSLDVECVATGKTHLKSDRAPCSLALVNGLGKTIMRTNIKVEKEIVSYLTPFTGLKKGDLDGGRAVNFKTAGEMLRQHLPRRAVLVGQNPQGDAEWMQLQSGVDFKEFVDLSEVFKDGRGQFSLRHEALVLLGKEAPEGVHDPAWDATVSIELYQLAKEATSKEMSKMREKLRSKNFWPPKPSLARACGYQIDGVCLSMYMKEHCICGMPILKN